MSQTPINIFWLRRDLRFDDNHGFYQAMQAGLPVLPLFIFDTNILDELEDEDDARVTFIHKHLVEMDSRLREKGSGLLVKKGKPADIWKKIANDYTVKGVYTNRDYEPYALERDKEINDYLTSKDIPLHFFKDHVIFEQDEVTKDDGDPYVVFTPYSKLWTSKLTNEALESYTSALQFSNFYEADIPKVPSLETIGFKQSTIDIPDDHVSDNLLSNYSATRDYPAKQGTSRLGVHLRFGTISIRKLASQARGVSHTYMNELKWREFYSMILWHFPKVVTENFKAKYDAVNWRNKEDEFDTWCRGETGYPMVDAGMRQLNETGYMHNRVRMVTASFLTKHLLIDWRWGEAYFAKKLLDYELASNNGGWQWAAGTGTDAQPYFRIFNPESQKEKFDPKEEYINEWIPEYGTDKYPERMVDHKEARERCLAAFKKALD